MRMLLLAVCLCIGSSVTAAPLVVETDPLTPEQQREKFHLPPGFEIQLVVSDPDIGQPMNMAFDAAGRLWVTSSVEYPYPVEGPGVEPRDARFGTMGKAPAKDRLTVISGIGADGKPSKIQHFASDLNIPIGILPLTVGSPESSVQSQPGDSSSSCSGHSTLNSGLTSAIVFSIPNLYLLTDTNGDMLADERKVLYGPFGNVDTHGMVNSLTRHVDGWVYANHGFRNTSTVKGTDGHEITMNSGNTFRFKIDGSRIEQVTWGQVNPFGMTVDRWGNFYNADCHSMPLTCLIPGAYYQSFGKPHDGLGFGPDMIDHGHGSTGICGVAWYEAQQFPLDYHDCIFLCNPVNGTVHRDRIKFRGSSPWVETQPEFITCDDGWFRPVDVKLGPDGALYVADFYNCIIGHYEVPLDHPRRDREKGRVWRIVYTGDRESRNEEQEKPESAPFSGDPTGRPSITPDLTALTNDQLIEKLGDANIVVRTLATNLLADRKPDGEMLRAISLDAAKSDIQRAMALWMLHRLGQSSSETIAKIAATASPDLSMQVAHLLGAMPDGSHAILKSLLEHQDAKVRRAAATASRDKIDLNLLSVLSDEFFPPAQRAELQDTHLLHAFKVAFRDQLQGTPGPETSSEEWNRRIIGHGTRTPVLVAECALSIKSETGAILAVEAMEGSDVWNHHQPLQSSETDARMKQLRLPLIRHVAQFGSRSLLESYLASLEGKRVRPERIVALRDGLLARGMTTGMLQPIATPLVQQLLTEPSKFIFGWHYLPMEPQHTPKNIFSPQQRPSADNVADAWFFSTLPAGEEQAGEYHSEVFECPESLSFYIAGHNGFPTTPLSQTNYVRLADAKSGEEIAREYPPRNDTAQLVTWDLSKSKGKEVSLTIVDGDTRDAYAWLAVGRFSLEGLNPNQTPPAQQAVELIAALNLTQMEPKLVELMLNPEVGMATRLAAGEAFLQIHPDSRRLALFAVAKHTPVVPLQEGCLAAIQGRDAALVTKLLTDIMKAATSEVQSQLAQVLINDPDGGEELLKLVEAGVASPRLLTRPDIRDRLFSLGIENIDARLEAVTKDIPPASEQAAQLIKARKALYEAATHDDATVAAGLEAFKKHCAVCHQHKGQGNKVGPQLDGIASRGVDRLLEDILDPNRNVDGAFRTTTIALTDGRVLNGLKRREEGATIVYANNEGKEFTVAAGDIEEQRVSPLSLMPANLYEKLTEAELSAVLRYLTSP